jgi:hypothetical protein
MAKVKLQPWVAGFSGKMGDVVFKQTSSGEVIIASRPDMSNVEWSPAQQAHRERFRQASEYATAALADPDVRAIYEKKAKKARKTPRNMAISDYFAGKDLLSKE